MKKFSIILLLVVTVAVVFPISSNIQAAPNAPIKTLDLPHIY